MNKHYSERDLEILNAKDDQTLADWYCALNRWDWPQELPDPEPPEYKSGGRRTQLMDWIYNKVGNRLISRTWNKAMTDYEFEDFYKGTYEGDAAARVRYMNSLEWNSRRYTADRRASN